MALANVMRLFYSKFAYKSIHDNITEVVLELSNGSVCIPLPLDTSMVLPPTRIRVKKSCRKFINFTWPVDVLGVSGVDEYGQYWM